MKIKLISNKFLLMMTSLLAVTSLFLVAATPVYAAGSEFPITPKAIPVRYTNDQLSSMFFHERTRFNNLRTNILVVRNLNDSETNEIMSNEMLKPERDLALYTATLNRAVDVRGDAWALLSSHPGFAENGDVTNSVLAASTINRLNFFLTNGQYWATQANIKFSKAQHTTQ